MKVLLTTLNSKYIHSNLALRYLMGVSEDLPISIAMEEYTINDNLERVMGGIFRHSPNIIGLSCYIWNIEETLHLVQALKKVMPESIIILGGPEVSYGTRKLMEDNPFVDMVLRGEGEVTFPLLLEGLALNKSLDNLKGISFRCGDNIIENEDRELIKDLDTLPFPYKNGFQGLENKIIYYETSRGCPFSCQYCLSSIDQGVRFLSLDRVREDIKIFIKAKIPQVKLVDRTFNCNPKRAREIFSLIMGMGGQTNFHFEICADLLDEETLLLLKEAPAGLFQFEIGVQSTKEDTLMAIERKTDLNMLYERVKRLQSYRNIHLHLDLIAGLPKEDFKSFQNSFNKVYDLKPDRLQLGFLKLLKGSGIRKDAGDWDYKFLSIPPYEVLENKYISFREILILKDIEELVEKYPNTHRFTNSLSYLAKVFNNNYFAMYDSFSEYWRDRGYFEVSHSQIRLYEILIEFVLELRDSRLDTNDGEGVLLDRDLVIELVKLDYISESRPSRYPKGIEEIRDRDIREPIRDFYHSPLNIQNYLPHLKGYTPSQIARRTHIELFQYNVLSSRQDKGTKPTILLFDYDIPNKLFKRSRIIEIDSL